MGSVFVDHVDMNIGIGSAMLKLVKRSQINANSLQNGATINWPNEQQ